MNIAPIMRPVRADSGPTGPLRIMPAALCLGADQMRGGCASCAPAQDEAGLGEQTWMARPEESPRRTQA